MIIHFVDSQLCRGVFILCLLIQIIGLLVFADNIDPNLESSLGMKYNNEELSLTMLKKKNVLNEWSPLHDVTRNSCSFRDYRLMILNRHLEAPGINEVPNCKKGGLHCRSTLDGYTSQRDNNSLESNSYPVKTVPERPIVCEDFDSKSKHALQIAQNVSGMQFVETPYVNHTNSTKDPLLVSSDKKTDELDNDRDQFFTWDSIILQVIVFFACFLLY